jgi:L-aminopeptidase/D-esterase-like protein
VVVVVVVGAGAVVVGRDGGAGTASRAGCAEATTASAMTNAVTEKVTWVQRRMQLCVSMVSS